jgi:hypothetical protein
VAIFTKVTEKSLEKIREVISLCKKSGWRSLRHCNEGRQLAGVLKWHVSSPIDRKRIDTALRKKESAYFSYVCKPGSSFFVV